MENVKLAWRSIWRNRRRTIITLASIALGLTVVIVAISIGDGIYYQMVDDAARMQAGHITIENPQYRKSPAVEHWVQPSPGTRKEIRNVEGVKFIKPLVLGQGTEHVPGVGRILADDRELFISAVLRGFRRHLSHLRLDA